MICPARFILEAELREPPRVPKSCICPPIARVKARLPEGTTVGGGIVTGAPWKSQIELIYSYNFGMFRDPGGAPPTKGGHGAFILWSKEL